MKHNTPAQEVKSLETLFFTFFKIGLFTFGGGYAMIALLEEEFIQRRKWLDKDEFLDMTAIAESTPGPVAINSATYLGYKLAKVPGAATATVAVCLPSFLIIYAISLFFEQFTQLTVIASAFKGIQVCVIYLIFSAGVRMLKALDKSPFATGVLAAVMLVMVGLSLAGVSVSSILLILLSGAAGVAAWLIGRRKEGK
jgi:chromate transporter